MGKLTRILFMFIIFLIAGAVIGALFLPGPPIDESRDEYNKSLQSTIENSSPDFNGKWIFVDRVTPELADTIKKHNGIVGTHHAYSYMKPSGFMETGGMFKTLYGIGGPSSPIQLRNIVTKFSVTQKQSLQDQYDMGVRVFDARFSRSDGQILIEHGVIFGTVQQFARDLAQVMKNGEKA